MWEFVADIGVLPRSHIFSLCLTPCDSRGHALCGRGGGGGCSWVPRSLWSLDRGWGLGSEGVEVQVGTTPRSHFLQGPWGLAA